MSELKKKKKMKISALYELTPKQFEPDHNPQNSLYLCPKKPKRNQIKLKARIEGNKENICYFAT